MKIKKSNTVKKQKKHNQGIITLPFLLVLIIILFFTLSFLMLSMTLTHVTVTQYMTYSSARKLSLAGTDRQTQLGLTLDHYKKLRRQFFKPNAHTGKTGDWFDIQENLQPHEQQYSSIQTDYEPEGDNSRKRFYGVNTRFYANALNLKIPFLIEEDSDQINQEIIVSSFLGREPSQAECIKFNEEKAKLIQELCSNSPTGCPNIQKPKASEGDNGC